MKYWVVIPKRWLLEMMRSSRQWGEVSNNINWLLCVAAFPTLLCDCTVDFEIFFSFFFFFVECLYWGRVEQDKPLWMKETLSGVGVTECKGGGRDPPNTPNQAPIWKSTFPCAGQWLLPAVLAAHPCWWSTSSWLADAEVAADEYQLLRGRC